MLEGTPPNNYLDFLSDSMKKQPFSKNQICVYS